MTVTVITDWTPFGFRLRPLCCICCFRSTEDGGAEQGVSSLEWVELSRIFMS
jgi:hypothetical protein